MADNETGMERNGNGLAGIVIRCIGTAMLGAAISTAGWMYYKFEDASTQRDAIRQRLSKIETSVEKFHDESYRWRDRREKNDDKQWEAIRKR